MYAHTHTHTHTYIYIYIYIYIIIQAEADWRVILHQRATELKKGGRMGIVSFARTGVYFSKVLYTMTFIFFG
jgi:hypothetical protein